MVDRAFYIRETVADDRPVLVSFMTQLQDFEKNLHSNRSEGTLIGNEHLAYLERLVKEQNGRIFIADCMGELLGFLVCFVEEIEADDKHLIASEKRFGYISDIFVTSNARGQGIATALIEKAENYFKSIEIFTVKITFLHNNQSAEKLYKKIGYQPYEIIYEKSLSR